MQITALKQQIKNPERVSIYVDDSYSFSLSLDELVAEKLKKGLEIDEPRLAALKKRSQQGKLRLRTLNWLLLRPHSTKELRDYLYRKKVEPELSDALIKDFTGKGYLNDAAFAKQWVEQRRRGKLFSTRRLKVELRQKGIPSEIIQEVLSDQTDNEQTALAELISKKGSLPRYKNDPQKFMQYLARQGFSYSNIKAALQTNQG